MRDGVTLLFLGKEGVAHISITERKWVRLVYQILRYEIDPNLREIFLFGNQSITSISKQTSWKMDLPQPSLYQLNKTHAKSSVALCSFVPLCFHSMQVILESLRMASIISFTFREAVADVEYKGKHVFNMDWESVYTVLESLNKS